MRGTPPSARGTSGETDRTPTRQSAVDLARSLADELAVRAGRAACVAPGWVRTAINAVAWRDNPDMIDNVLANQALDRLGEAGEVAGAVAFLASDDGAFTTGIVLPVDDGMSNVQGETLVRARAPSPRLRTAARAPAPEQVRDLRSSTT